MATKHEQDIIIKTEAKKTADTKKKLRGVDAATKKLAKSVLALGAGYLTLATAQRTLAGMWDAAQIASKSLNIERSFENLSYGAEVMLASIKKATAGTISEFKLMQQFNTAAMLGLPLDQFDKMMSIARGASQATGQSMEYMLSSIVTGIGRGSKLMLDNLGIMISMEVANIKYAKSLGIATSELDDFQRKQAFADEAVRIGMANLEKAGGVIESSADSYDQLTASLENLRIEAGKAFNVLFSPTAGGVARGLEDAKLFLKSIRVGLTEIEELQVKIRIQEKIGEWWESIGVGSQAEKAVLKMVGYYQEIADLQKTMTEQAQQKALEVKLKNEAAEVARLKENIDLLLGSMQGLIEFGKLLAFDLFPLEEIEAYSESILRTAEAAKKLGIEFDKSAAALTKHIDTILPSFEGIENIIDSLNPKNRFLLNSMQGMASAMLQATIYTQTWGQAMVAAIKAIAVELASKAALFLLLEFILPGSSSLGGKAGFISFLGGGGLDFSKSPGSSPPTPAPITSQTPVFSTQIYAPITIIGDPSDASLQILQDGLDRIGANA